MRVALTLLLMMSAATAGRAEPGPVTRFFMETNVSQFSLGLLRLNMELEAWREKNAGRLGSRPIAAADYEWDANRIIVQVSLGSSERGEKARELCAQLVNEMRLLSGVDPKTGQLYIPSFGSSFFARYFAPMGYTLKAMPENALAKLDQIVSIKVNVGTKCEGPLMSNKVLHEGP